MDPAFLTAARDSWSQEVIEEIEENVAPFFGIRIDRDQSDAIGYEPSSLYDTFERYAQLFKQEARYRAFTKVHRQMLQEVESRLPREENRPSIGFLNNGSNPSSGEFYALPIREVGTECKQFRDLGVENAFREWALYGYEGVLETDPEVIVYSDSFNHILNYMIMEGGAPSFDYETFRDYYVQSLKENSVGQQVTAVQEGNVYPGGVGQQGPVTNLYNTEILAQQLYPEQFGEFDPENPFESPEEHQLFDRQRAADIINGDF
ncbi:ABC transporter substrate-binding protein [Halomicrobium katesii]|uniref:ABC transporter substrate-binding protein n=1 Tax=Halomicrobium katesii TaxID=437163 RepID=UPI00036010DF|nr:ABC transporter substrate-binding protein [Halomicrobium katesii]